MEEKNTTVLASDTPSRPYREEFWKDLVSIINKHSIENLSDTPDFILAEYIMKCLDAFELASNKRMRWQNRTKVPHGLNDMPK